MADGSLPDEKGELMNEYTTLSHLWKGFFYRTVNTLIEHIFK